MTDETTTDKAMTSAEQFFYLYGPTSVASGETYEQGKRRSAREYARAEQWAKDNEVEYQWSDDWDVGSHEAYYGAGWASVAEPGTCENCDLYLRDSDGDLKGSPAASLGCIDDADANYRRVIEAELALEVMSNDGASS